MGNLYEALGFLGMLCGLTVIADRLTSKETRKLIGENIRSALEHPRNPKFTNPVSFIEKIRPFSLRSLLTSFAFSIYALTIVLYIQYFMFGYDFSDIYKGVDGVHIKDFTLFLIFIVFSNFFVDFLSFTQTLVFVRRKWPPSWVTEFPERRSRRLFKRSCNRSPSLACALIRNPRMRRI